MNIFDKLAKLVTIAGEATIEYFKTSAQMYELGSELTRDLILDLKSSAFGEALQAIRSPLRDVMAINKEAQAMHKSSWRDLVQAVRKEVNPAQLEEDEEDEVEAADLVN